MVLFSLPQRVCEARCMAVGANDFPGEIIMQDASASVKMHGFRRVFISKKGNS